MENNLNTPDVTFIYNNEFNPDAITPESISNLKIIGGLGAIFAAGTIIPYLGALLGIASIVLLLIAFYRISKMSGIKSIFSNICYAYIITFVLTVGLMIFMFISLFDFFSNMSHNNYLYDNDFAESFFYDIKENLLAYVIGISLFFYLITILYAYLWKLSLDKTAVFFNAEGFKTAGLLYMIGAPAIILCGLGFLVTLAAHIVLAIAFFNLQPPKSA